MSPDEGMLQTALEFFLMLERVASSYIYLAIYVLFTKF